MSELGIKYRFFRLLLIMIAFISVSFTGQVFGQNVIKYVALKGKLTSMVTNEHVGFVTITLRKSNETYKTISNESGLYFFSKLPAGTYNISFSSLNYNLKELEIVLSLDRALNISLEPMKRLLNEVYVTASESKGMTSSSIIDKKAMQLLQPSSFTDLLELLPGGRSIDPRLTRMNQIRLRESNNDDSNFDISSLGTAFYIDDAPINTTANMQTTSGFTVSDPNSSRNSTNKGVDMRSISTDQIEKVEIVRGIPSVEYGDLTSGLIKIDRKKGESALSARIKADGFSKLAAIGKGFSFPKQNLTLNADLDFLDSKSDPRDNYENYKRVTGSIRTEKFWQNNGRKITWGVAIDYATTVDNVKSDPDNSYALTDRYKSEFNGYGLSNKLSVLFKKKSLLKSIDIATKISYQQDKIDLAKWMQTRTAVILANSLVAGAHDASYLTPSYVANLVVDGKPLNAFVKASANLGFKSGMLSHRIKLGAETNYSKNFGEGQQYDLNYPANAAISARPRSYKSIPSMQNLSFFAEDMLDFTAGKHHFSVAAGLRGMGLLNMDDRYAIADRIYADPRINAKWYLPKIDIAGDALGITLGGGYGLQTKLPTLNQLYPDNKYIDLIQLNFYHNTQEFRKANVMTYIIDNANFDLRAAVNKKWEFNADAFYDGNRFSVTYFKENMSSGFRSASRYQALAYKKYDITSIDASNLTAQPALSDFKYQDLKEFYSYSIATNGSELIKEGIEYQFTSKRISSINTRFTINGAWFKTRYLSSLPLYSTIGTSVITDGKIRQYIGIYDQNEGYKRSQLNTNLSVDSYVPRLGLMLFVSVQSLWYTSRQDEYRTGVPVAYMDINENVYPYTASDVNDPILKWLNLNYTSTMFRKNRVPLDMQVNIKASKEFKNKARVSMFVNRILTYTPDYSFNGVTVRRQGFSSPYFGMELNFNL